MEMLVVLPSYADDILAVVAERDWLIHNFNTSDSHGPYNPANYLYNYELENIKYRAVVDLNIFQFLVKCTKKKPQPHKNYRDAAAFLVFCQMAKIEIEPCFAVYERLNYNDENLNEALTELQSFRNLDNGDMDSLAMYALGFSDVIEAEVGITIDRDDLGQKLLKYRRLKDWDSLYLIVLAIIQTHVDDAVPKSGKLVAFIDWIVSNFRLSLPGVMYAVRLFGRQPLKRMMKYRTNQTTHERRSAAFNMTWDMYLMTRFFKYWTDKDASCETLFVSDDNALRAVLRLSIDVQKAGKLDPIGQYLEPQVFKSVCDLLENHQSHKDRIYGTEQWVPEHRAALISELERKLFS
jgi:hypothetical protein